MAKKSAKASALPVIVAGLSFLVSVFIYLSTKAVAHALVLHLVAYVSTPLVVALCLAWDSIAQRVGRGNDPWFSTNATYPLMLRILTGVSFLAAIPHIMSIASDLAEKIHG
jgi:hypothetical protein